MFPFRWMTAVRALSLCGLAITAFGCQSMHGWSMNRIGMRAYQEGNYAAAKDAFQKSLYDDPMNADYAHNLGAALKKSGDVAGAEQAYRHALALDPSHQPAHHSLSMLLLEQGRIQEAGDLAQMWADTEPYLPESHIELAWFQRETGDLAGAEQSLKNALHIAPNHEIATALLGDLYRETGQPDRAVAMYQRSLQKNWFQPQVQSRLATMNATSARTAQVLTPQSTTAWGVPMAMPAYASATPTPQVVAGTPGPVIAASPIVTPGQWVPAGSTVSAPVISQPTPVPTLAAPQFEDASRSDTAVFEEPQVAPH
jgi:tetratricopeptide (TPR) repeat protein